MRTIQTLLFLSLICLNTNLAKAQDTVASSVQEENPTVEATTLATLLEALILQEGIEVIKANIEASRNESGEIDKAIRATLGISVRDIKKYGLLGGPNSEMRKLFESLGLVEELNL